MVASGTLSDNFVYQSCMLVVVLGAINLVCVRAYMHTCVCVSAGSVSV